MTSDHNITTGKTYQHVIEELPAPATTWEKTVRSSPSPTTSSGGSANRRAPMPVSHRVGGTVRGHRGHALPRGASSSSPTRNPEERPLHPSRSCRTRKRRAEDESRPSTRSGGPFDRPSARRDRPVRTASTPGPRKDRALFCDIPTDAVFSNPDVEDALSRPADGRRRGARPVRPRALPVSPMRRSRRPANEPWRHIVTTEKTARSTSRWSAARSRGRLHVDPRVR